MFLLVVIVAFIVLFIMKMAKVRKDLIRKIEQKLMWTPVFRPTLQFYFPSCM